LKRELQVREFPLALHRQVLLQAWQQVLLRLRLELSGLVLQLVLQLHLKSF
jgi:hypothetical protein